MLKKILKKDIAELAQEIAITIGDLKQEGPRSIKLVYANAVRRELPIVDLIVLHALQNIKMYGLMQILRRRKNYKERLKNVPRPITLALAKVGLGGKVRLLMENLFCVLHVMHYQKGGVKHAI